MNLIVDSHEDLTWNMFTFGRDYTRPVHETRRLESGASTIAQNGDTLLGWDAYQEGNVALIFSTLYVAPSKKKMGEWDTQFYTNTEQAHRLYLAQLDAYHRLVDEHPDKFQFVLTKSMLKTHLDHWSQPAAADGYPLGLIPLMEGAEGVRNPGELPEWWEKGLRTIGPAWAGTRYCGGTGEPGPLTKDGYALLEAMAEIGFTLDLSHMDREAALQALDVYQGRIIASHANPLAMLKGSDSNRHLSDEVIDGIFERDGVIGVIPANRFLKFGWMPGDERSLVPLQTVADHIDYYCQKAGDAKHAGIGTDFDGGFGLQSVPDGIDTIADLHKLAPIFEARGYSPSDITAIYGGNWIDHLQKALPE